MIEIVIAIVIGTFVLSVGLTLFAGVAAILHWLVLATAEAIRRRVTR